ncbi:hypothetical protein Tco_0609872, partial [Tanacetum coccineum]
GGLAMFTAIVWLLGGGNGVYYTWVGWLTVVWFGRILVTAVEMGGLVSDIDEERGAELALS